MRQTLLTGFQDSVQYGKSFSHYTTENSTVTAHFSDGTTASGSFLVGSDGGRSRVASQLTNGASIPFEISTRAIYGKTFITPELEEKLHPLAKGGISFINQKTGKDGGMFLFVEPMRFTHDSSEKDYVYFAATAKAEDLGVSEETMDAAQGQAALDIVTKAIKSWLPGFRIVLEQADPRETANLKFRIANPDGLPVWETSPLVTAIGDAIHPTPPTGGIGNYALKDAEKLGEALIQSLGQGEDKVKELVRKFEDEMRERTNSQIKAAYDRLAGLTGPPKMERMKL